MILCDENLRAPKDKAAAKVEEVEEREPVLDELGKDCDDWPFLDGSRLS